MCIRRNQAKNGRTDRCRLIAVTCAMTIGLAATACGGAARTATGSDHQSSGVEDKQLVDAFDMWWMLPSTCSAVLKRSTLKIALVGHDYWAIADFGKPVSCVDSVPAATPWAGVPAPLGVFERSASGAWQMNGAQSFPFPCPSPTGAEPTFYDGVGVVPLEALNDWHMHYASGCAHVDFPPVPGQ
jgi:hypothetical protein